MVVEPYWINEVDQADWFSGDPRVDAGIRGRFPGRNVALGRQSTPAEVEALQGPNTSFKALCMKPGQPSQRFRVAPAIKGVASRSGFPHPIQENRHGW